MNDARSTKGTPDAPLSSGDDGSTASDDGGGVEEASSSGDDASTSDASTGDAASDGSTGTGLDGEATDGAKSDGEGTTENEAGHDSGLDSTVAETGAGGAVDATVSDGATGDGATALCPSGEQQCANDAGVTYCAATVTDNDNCGACGNVCGTGYICSGSACALTCGALATCTADGGATYCANTTTDDNNCGSCGNVCGAGYACSGGNCILQCGALTTCSSGASQYCADLATDNANCGTCGNGCASGYACSGSGCALTCGALTTCTPDAGAPYCANTATDNNNCGGCGNVCTSGHTCSGGQCIVTCGALTTCTPDGGTAYCANTSTDNSNCGTCGNTCPSGDVCGGGTCAVTCGSLAKCTPDGGATYCANTSTDQQNCGSCGNACGSGQACISGVCTATCGSGQQVCGNSCTSTSYDPNNCGTCGDVCTYPNATAACGGGTCVLATCSTGYGNCDNLAANGCEANLETSAANCGACGNACDLGDTCQSGTCTFQYSQHLLGYWAFNDTPGSTTAKDSSGNNLTGNLIGGAAIVAGVGKQGTGGIIFTGGYVDVPFANDAAGQGTGSLYIPQGNETFCMWFKTTASGSPVQGLQVVWGESFPENGTGGTGGYDRVIGNGSVGPLNYNVWSEINPVGTTTVNDANWHQVCYVLDETYGTRAYVDGASDMTDPGGSTTNCGLGCSGFNWASDYLIGTGKSGRYNAGNFAGTMDEVRIYNIALTTSEVNALYNATK